MNENHNLFLFLMEINNMHCTRHILPIPRTCIWHRCGRCGRYGVSWHRSAVPKNGESAYYSRHPKWSQNWLMSVELVLLCMFQTILLMGN